MTVLWLGCCCRRGSGGPWARRRPSRGAASRCEEDGGGGAFPETTALRGRDGAVAGDLLITKELDENGCRKIVEEVKSVHEDKGKKVGGVTCSGIAHLARNMKKKAAEMADSGEALRRRGGAIYGGKQRGNGEECVVFL